MYWWQFAIAERNAGELTDTPLTDIVWPSGPFINSPMIPTPSPAGARKLGMRFPRMHRANLTASVWNSVWLGVEPGPLREPELLGELAPHAAITGRRRARLRRERHEVDVELRRALQRPMPCG